jgi:hypothetical protein
MNSELTSIPKRRSGGGAQIQAPRHHVSVRPARRDPEKLFERLCALDGLRHDPCLLDTFVAAVAYAHGEPARPWWEFSRERKARTMADLELRLGWVIVYVDDPTTASAFYQGTFGLRSEFAAPDGSYAQLDTGPTKLAFASYALGVWWWRTPRLRRWAARERRDHPRRRRR